MEDNTITLTLQYPLTPKDCTMHKNNLLNFSVKNTMNNTIYKIVEIHEDLQLIYIKQKDQAKFPIRLSVFKEKIKSREFIPLKDNKFHEQPDEIIEGTRKARRTGSSYSTLLSHFSNTGMIVMDTSI